jgi:hypothetical protein
LLLLPPSSRGTRAMWPQCVRALRRRQPGTSTSRCGTDALRSSSRRQWRRRLRQICPFQRFLLLPFAERDAAVQQRVASEKSWRAAMQAVGQRKAERAEKRALMEQIQETPLPKCAGEARSGERPRVRFGAGGAQPALCDTKSATQFGSLVGAGCASCLVLG